MGEVYSHLSGEGRRIIRVEVGSDASIRGISAMPSHDPFNISREIKHGTWFLSSENESYHPCRSKRLKAESWASRYCITELAQRRADRRESKP